jgi:Cu/Ag efflux protein CusF
MNRLFPIALGLAVAVSASSMAAAEKKMPEVSADQQTGQPGAAGAALVTLTATVTAVDMDKREVTLKGPEGNEVTLTVGPEVRNLAQVNVGDEVVINYYEGLALKLEKGGSGIRETEETVTGTRAPLGEKPAGTLVRTVDAVGTVQAVDREARKVVLRGTQRTLTLKVADDVNLDDIKVGDQVLARYTQALAISVQPKAGEDNGSD